MAKKIISHLLLTIMSIAFCTIVSGCSDDLCQNKIIYSIESPDKQNVVHVFTRDCGATTKQSFQALILKNGVSIGSDVVGNIFVSYDSFEVKWTNNKEIVITTSSKKDDVFKQESIYKDIKIKYVNY